MISSVQKAITEHVSGEHRKNFIDFCLRFNQTKKLSEVKHIIGSTLFNTNRKVVFL